MGQTYVYTQKTGNELVTFPAGTKMIITLKGARGSDRTHNYNGTITTGRGGPGGEVKFNYTSDGSPLEVRTFNSDRRSAEIRIGANGTVLGIAGGGGQGGQAYSGAGNGGQGGTFTIPSWTGKLTDGAGGAGSDGGNGSGGRCGSSTYKTNDQTGQNYGGYIGGYGGYGFYNGQGGRSFSTGAGGGGGGSSYVYDVAAIIPTSSTHNNLYSEVVIEVLNATPTVILNTTEARTLYENDTFTIDGQASDSDNGNIVNVKYQIGAGTVRAIATGIRTA